MNNRQAGRRRGRGGQRSQGGSPNPNNGNRIDNRARGNAAQLLEKYKNLARDAQMQGDRVNTEYYLQFADHYFRVLNESRSRVEEQRRPRDESYDGDDEDDFDGEVRGQDRGGDRPNGYANGHANGASHDDDHDDDDQPRRQDREDDDGGEMRRAAPRGRDTNDRGGNERAAGDRGGNDRGNADRGPRRPRRDAEPREARADERRDRAPRGDDIGDDDRHAIDATVLPPALGASVTVDGDDAEPVKRPRRRRVRAEEDSEPAA